MKRCKQCDCNLPDDYDLDYCPSCLDDTEGLIPDSVRPFEEPKKDTKFRKKAEHREREEAMLNESCNI